MSFIDTSETGGGRPIGSVPETVSGSSGAGEDRFGDKPQSLADTAAAAADAKAAADTATLLASRRK